MKEITTKVELEDISSILDNPDEVLSVDAVDIVEAASNNSDNEEASMPTLRGSDYPPAYSDMVKRILFQYNLLPLLDYLELYRELSDLSVKSCPTPTLQVLNDELQKVQGAKDRLSEILICVIQNHNFKKRAVDILKDAWGKFSSEKNADSRKGDSAFRLSNFMIDYANSESLLKACSHVLKNLDSIHDSLSRRITIYQLTIKLQDIGRGSLPDYDFDKKGELLQETPVGDLPTEIPSRLQDDGQLNEEKF